MQSFYNIFKSLKINSHAPQMNFDSFQLISKVPFAPYYNEYKFIPIIHKTENNEQNDQKPIYFSKQIGCADDMVYHATREFNDEKNKNLVEYRALGFRDRFRDMIMQASSNPLCEKAKYIIFTCNALGSKYNNPILGIFENTHPNADKNMKIEYELYTTI
jgi:hypothetical protein